MGTIITCYKTWWALFLFDIFCSHWMVSALDYHCRWPADSRRIEQKSTSVKEQLLLFFLFPKWKVSVVQLWRYFSDAFPQQQSRNCKGKKAAKLEQRSILSGIITVYLCWIWAVLTVLVFLFRFFTAYTRLYVLCPWQGFLTCSDSESHRSVIFLHIFSKILYNL